jgi:hypothetical protein
MPRRLSGGFFFHCGHVYQRNDPEFWLAEESPHRLYTNQSPDYRPNLIRIRS